MKRVLLLLFILVILVGVANYVDSIPNVSEKVIDVHNNKVHKIVFYYGKSEFAFVDSDGWKSNLKFRINRGGYKKVPR